jgi:hypothetical protein
MIDEIDDILYRWKTGMITRDQAEDQIVDLVVQYEQLKRDRAAKAASTSTTPRTHNEQ